MSEQTLAAFIAPLVMALVCMGFAREFWTRREQRELDLTLAVEAVKAAAARSAQPDPTVDRHQAFSSGPPDLAAIREKQRRLDRHPVGSVEGYREAWSQTFQDPTTPLEQCDTCEREASRSPHLYRKFATSFDPHVDTRMKRCDGSMP